MKSCVLFSGGWDSVAVALKAPKSCDLLFFNYGQTYYGNELKAAKAFAKEYHRKLIVREIHLKHDMERRNFYLMMEAKRLGYEEIYTGNRNVLPFLDKYRDSNWLSIKLLAILCNLKIKMPIVGWGKRRIVKFCMKSYSGTPYNCYFNRTNYLECTCPNCKELKRLNLMISTG